MICQLVEDVVAQAIRLVVARCRKLGGKPVSKVHDGHPCGTRPLHVASAIPAWFDPSTPLIPAAKRSHDCLRLASSARPASVSS